MKIFLLLLALFLLAIGLLWAFLQGPLREPEDAMRDFLGGENRFEDQLTDPLVLAGPGVRPLVASAVVDREMKYRRYALAYLGCSGYEPAGPILRRILTDETERDYFRADALEALWRLDRSAGESEARRFRGREDNLGGMAAKLLDTGRPWADCRSWIAAATHRHG